MPNPHLRTIVLVAALVMWYLAARAVWSAASGAQAAGSDAAGRETVAHAYVDSVVRAALQPSESLASRTYQGGRGNPFLLLGKSGQTAVRAARTKPQRAELYLNGVLLRASRPQAILADDAGRTFIAGVGDEVLGQRIVRIEPDKVTLRHGRSTYAIQVRD